MAATGRPASICAPSAMAIPVTLINGRRAFGLENINAIPIGALSRIEVLKDGASAIYGSDAVAGVVNFILLNGPGETPFQGAEINLLYGNTTDRDARVIQGSFRGGVVHEKLAIAVAAEYYDRANLFARDRETSQSADVRTLALVYAWTGEQALAIEQLEIIAKIPAGPSYGELRFDPTWDSLRGDPRFEKIVTSLTPKQL